MNAKHANVTAERNSTKNMKGNQTNVVSVPAKTKLKDDKNDSRHNLVSVTH